MMLLTSEEKKLYYKFIYNKWKKYYYCSKCYNPSKLLLTATIQNEGKENGFLYVRNQKHVCEPFEYSSVFQSNIVKPPNFLLLKRKTNGKIMQRLVVFTNEEKSECFEYTWYKLPKHYTCYACTHRHNCSVYAKIFKYDEDQECVYLSDNIHKCKPIKFVPENLSSNIVQLPGFKLFETALGKRNIKKLAIFDPKNRNSGYIYTYQEDRKNYECMKCKRMKNTRVIAKVVESEDDKKLLN